MSALSHKISQSKLAKGDSAAAAAVGVPSGGAGEGVAASGDEALDDGVRDERQVVGGGREAAGDGGGEKVKDKKAGACGIPHLNLGLT